MCATNWRFYDRIVEPLYFDPTMASACQDKLVKAPIPAQYSTLYRYKKGLYLHKSLVVGGGGVMVEERRGEACRECRWCVGGVLFVFALCLCCFCVVFVLFCVV